MDVLLNVLLFVPLGVGLRISGLRTWLVCACGLAVSLLVETLQLTLIPGRDASLSDLVTNTLGSWAGAIAGQHLTRLLFPSEGQATSLALGGALAWLAVQAGTAILLRPWAPDEIRGGAWARAAPDRIPFDGMVTAVALSGWSIPNGPMPVSKLAAKLRQGDVRLEVRLLSGSNAAAWSPVFELLGPRGPLLSLESVGRDLAFHPPTQSSRVRLRRPGLRLDAALPPASGVPLRVTAQARGDTLSASWSIAGGPNFRSLQVLGPSLGWSLITPIRYAFGSEVRWITGVWIAGWLAVIGYWSAARRAPPLISVSGMTLLLCTGLALVPGVLSYPVSHWTEWLAGAAGAGIGHAAHYFAAYLGKGCDSPSIKESC
ncbi:MAG TPA: VanZ family protein [Gemmatimonadales bacterium]|nr:VanZ family protein [Gemmatimonadales bacterium]